MIAYKLGVRLHHFCAMQRWLAFEQVIFNGTYAASNADVHHYPSAPHLCRQLIFGCQKKKLNVNLFVCWDFQCCSFCDLWMCHVYALNFVHSVDANPFFVFFSLLLLLVSNFGDIWCVWFFPVGFAIWTFVWASGPHYHKKLNGL